MKEPIDKRQNEAEYQEFVTGFINDCNTPGALGCKWIVRVRQKSGRRRYKVTAEMAFKSHTKHVFTVDNFLDWWRNTYLKNYSSTNRTWVEISANYTPTEICVPKLEAWLCSNPHVKNLTINFGFFYTWNYKRRKVPKSVYIGRLQNLGNFPNSDVRIRKIKSRVLSALARQARVSFPGYHRPRHSNSHLERYVINHR